MPYHQWPYFSTACFPLQKLNILMKRKLGNTGKQMITFHQTDEFLHSVCCLQKPPLPLCPCVCVCVCDRFKCVSNHQVHIFLSGLDFYYKSHVCWKKNLTVIETQTKNSSPSYSQTPTSVTDFYQKNKCPPTSAGGSSVQSPSGATQLEGTIVTCLGCDDDF